MKLKKLLLTILIISFPIIGFSQSVSVELNTGGFSFIPAFTSNEPNIILNGTTNPERKFTTSFIGQILAKDLRPRGIIFIHRYKFLDKGIKGQIGLHLPAFQIDENYHVSNFVANDLTLSYKVSDNFTLVNYLLRGQGVNSDFTAIFNSISGIYQYKKLNFQTQAYYLDLDNAVGIAEKITYSLGKNYAINGFANYTFTDQFFISTFGISRTF